MAFENSLQRLNAAAAGRLSNAAAVIDGAAAVRIVFDNGFGASFDALGVRHPRAGLPESAVSAVVPGTSTLVLVGGSIYTIESVEPDGTGWAELQLRLAA